MFTLTMSQAYLTDDGLFDQKPYLKVIFMYQIPQWKCTKATIRDRNCSKLIHFPPANFWY